MDLEVGRITGKFSNKKYMRLIKKKTYLPRMTNLAETNLGRVIMANSP